MNKFNLNRVKFIFAVAVSLGILAVLFAKIELKTAFTVVQKSDFRLLLLAALISVYINVVIGALKWRKTLLYMGCALSFKEALSIRTACMPFKIIFPLKSSELLKAFYLNREKDLSFGQAVGSIILEKALNILITLCIFLVGLVFIDLDIPWAFPALFVSLIIYMVFSKRFIRALAYLAGKIHSKAAGFMNEVLHGFKTIGAKRKVVLLLYSLIFQSSEFINTYILLKAVGVSVPLALILVYVPVAIFVNNLPVTVMGIGTREALFVFLFARYGVSGSLLSAGLLVSLFEHVLPMLTGLFFMRYFLEHVSMRPDPAPRNT